MAKMLILRGNHGAYPDEAGKRHDYARGALHERAAIEYAKRRGYDGEVLDVSGDPAAVGNRSHSPQTLMALSKFHADDTVAAFYGFSGGGYNVWWIIRALKEADLKRIKLLVVLGAPDRPAEEYDASHFTGAGWELVYRTNPPATAAVVPKDAGSHMFGPEWLLSQTTAPNEAAPDR